MLIKKPFKKGVWSSTAPYYKAGGGGLDPATSAWIAAVITAGGTVSGTQQTNVDTLIKAYKSAGIFTLHDRMWLYASENVQQAAIDIISLASHTLVGTPAFTANRGYDGNGFSGSIDTNYITGTNFTLNANSFGAYVTTSTTAFSNTIMGESNLDGSTCNFVAINGSAVLQFDDCNGAFPTLTNANTKGRYIFTRTSSTNIAVYKNGTSIGPATSSSFTVPNIHWFVLGYNNNGSLAGQTQVQVASVFMGGTLNSTQAAAKDAADAVYMTAVGA